MIITQDTKSRFVKMLMTGQVIVIESATRNKANDYKFIGASSNGRWDFTPMIAELTGSPKRDDYVRYSVRSTDGIAVIANALVILREQGTPGIPKGNHETLYFKAKDLTCKVYI